jgi:hypothetical protein
MLPESKPTPGVSSGESCVSPHDLLRLVHEVPALQGAEFAAIWASIVARWIGPGHEARAWDTADALVAFEAFQARVRRTRKDPRVPAESETMRKLMVELERRASDVRAMLDRDFADGLRRRVGTYIAPQAVVELYPHDADAMLAFALVRDLRRAVTEGLPRPAATVYRAPEPATLAMTASEMPSGLAVCEGCTIVFEPRRKAHARYCRRCDKRPPTRASFLTRVPAPGKSVALRVPELAPGEWLEGLERWRTIQVARCAECRHLFTPTRKDAVICSGGCEQKHRRREAA